VNRRPTEPLRVGIVGGGFSGAAIAAHLAAIAGRSSLDLELGIVEPRASLGGGLAYGDAHEEHLLNVPAGRLGLWPDRPGHFHTWCVARGLGDDPAAFRPRGRFGEYVTDELAEALHRHRARVAARHVRAAATSVRLRADAVEIAIPSGPALRFDQVVLALGHGPVRRPAELDPIAGDPRLLSGPWDEAAMARLADARRVLLVGTGLTMIDAVLSLERRGFRGEIVAISRRGLIARSHAPARPAEHAAWAAGLAGGSLPELLRAIRVRLVANDDWRGVIDALRPETSRLWRSLSLRDRRRFGTRLAALWDAHRHRCPPGTAAIVASLRREGRLSIFAARIAGAKASGDGLHVDLAQRREPHPRRERFDAVLLCTGGEPDPARWGSPLVDGLLRDGLARIDGAGLGLDTDEFGFLRGDGHRRLSLLGPARRGELWESTAVPELARQAAGLAAALVDRFRILRGEKPPFPFALRNKEIA